MSTGSAISRAASRLLRRPAGTEQSESTAGWEWKSRASSSSSEEDDADGSSAAEEEVEGAVEERVGDVWASASPAGWRGRLWGGVGRRSVPGSGARSWAG